MKKNGIGIRKPWTACFSMMLALVVFLSAQGSIPVSKAEEYDGPAGGKELTVIEVDDDKAQKLYAEQALTLWGEKIDDKLKGDELSEELTVISQRHEAHSGYSDEYSKFTNDFFYDKMSAEQKRTYDGLYQACNLYLTGDDTITRFDSQRGVVSTLTGLSKDDRVELMYVFLNCNPQFWFLSEGITSGTNTVGITTYGAFLDGGARRTATNRMMGVVNQWLSQVNAQGSTVAKERKAYDLIGDNTEYGDSTYAQSAYSVFVEKKSLCAGYSEAFEMLCNAAGITTLSITSEKHQWNQVKLDSGWNLVDVTWGDTTANRDAYFNKAEATVSGYSSYSAEMHTPDSFWSKFGRPVCAKRWATGESGAMYRLYNPNSGEHFFTLNADECDMLANIGWHYEGVSCKLPDSSGTPVYRLYNANGGEHHYTTSADEKDMLVKAGWKYEGIGWYSSDDKKTPLYRVYNPNAFANNHHYTTNAEEKNYLVSLGWRDEGIGWYGK